MTTAWQVLAVVVEVVTWLSSPPTSLADAARREALRRQYSGAAVAVASNATLPMPTRPSDIAGPVATPAAGAPEGEMAVPPVVLTVRRPAPDAPAPDPPVDEETSWRRRAAGLRASLLRDRDAHAAAESQLALLRTQAVSRDDPAQQATLRQQIGTTIAELDTVTRRIAEGERALRTLADEARRFGIPPGWLR